MQCIYNYVFDECFLPLLLRVRTINRKNKRTHSNQEYSFIVKLLVKDGKVNGRGMSLVKLRLVRQKELHRLSIW